jgi:hypothetical protein
VVDRREGIRRGARGLADVAVFRLTGREYVLEAWSALIGDVDRVEVIAPQAEGAPSPQLRVEIETRLSMLNRSREPGGTGKAVAVVIAAARLDDGRFWGVTDLLLDRPSTPPVALAIIDLARPGEPGRVGWSWAAGELIVGVDPVAVDRVALRVLDSARRATGAPPLELFEGPGTPRLEEAAGRLSGQADLERIDWIKIPVTN